MVSAIEMARMDAHGPRTMEATPIPTAWPVVPPGSGRLNIMITKEKAAKREIKGIKPRVEGRFHALERDIPEGRGGGGQSRAGRGTQIAIGDVHLALRPA